MRRIDRGSALLETMVALAILAAAGMAAAGLTASSLRAELEAGVRERELANANRLLSAMTLLSTPDLERRIGRYHIGSLVGGVQRPARGLYRIAVAAASRPDVELMVTVVHRPEPPR